MKYAILTTALLTYGCSEQGFYAKPDEQGLGQDTSPVLDLPVAICGATPAEVSPPFESSTLAGSDSYDPEGIAIAEYDWRFIDIPDASSVTMPPGGANRQFTPDVAGDYVAELVVRTEDGRDSEPCVTTVTAIPSQDLWVEMYWVSEGDDMDLHLLAPGGSLVGGYDCYYGNCDGGSGLEWGEAGPADNPSLDLDDIPGNGPENINISSPQDGEFTVVVHDHTSYTFTGGNEVTVNVYIAGELEWTDSRVISGENSYNYFCSISWPDGYVTSL